MKRYSLRSFFLSLFIAIAAVAQNPVVTNQIGDRVASAGGAATTVDLRSHFTMEGVTTPLVRFDTTFGEFDVELLEEAAPNHVANFLGYTDRQDFDNTIIHRLASFTSTAISIVQGGGYKVEETLTSVTKQGPVALEYELPNARGTLAAARTADVDSATSEWYFNTEDNSTTLGPDNGGGYTTYGRVLGDGMDVVDLISSINTFNIGSAFGSIPLRFYNGGTPTEENFVMVNTVRRIDLYPTSVDTASALTFTVSSSDTSVATASINGSILSIVPVSAGTVTLTVNAVDVSELVVSQTMTYTVGGATITTQPASTDVATGSNATLSVVASSDDPITYQWYRLRSGETGAGQLLSGATGPTLNLGNVATSDMGFYWAVLTSGGFETRSNTAIVTLAGGSSRLANLSTRGRIPANGALTPGFVLRGTGNKSLVVRAVGPQLQTYGVQSALADPAMAIIPTGGTDAVVSNDNWGTSANAATLIATSAALGAFPLDAGSNDAAVLTQLPLPNAAAQRGYTVRITSTSTTDSGIALAEVYDPDAVDSDLQLTNVSALGFSGEGEDVLSPGFVIEGTGAKTMLIRVVGPSLQSYGVTGTMTDPKLSLIPVGQTDAIASNDNWGGTAVLTAAFASTGAFGFDSNASLDAAVLVRLPPGGYTVKPEGADGGTGTILVEAYEVIE